MGAIAGILQGLGAHMQKQNENNLLYQHQAYNEQALQYDRMAQAAEANGNDALAADMHKASFAIRTAMPGTKPKPIKEADGSSWDPMDMQGIIQKHTRLAMQQQQQQGQPPQVVAPNGITPQTGQHGLFMAPQQMTAPPAGGGFNAVPNPTQSIRSQNIGPNVADFYK